MAFGSWCERDPQLDYHCRRMDRAQDRPAGRLLDRTAIITGATRGIGHAVAQLFVAEGARVVLVARDTNRGKSIASQLGEDRAAYVAGDVADPSTAKRATETARRMFSGIDILVNNAGMDFVKPLLDVEPSEVRRVFDTNLLGPLLFIQATARAMEGRGGSIINVVSRTANVGIPMMGVYGASKGALLSLTRAAAIELASSGIRVNAVAPGVTDTPLIRSWIEDQPNPTAFEADVSNSIPQKRIGRPEEVADAILFLASSDASHVTGACIPVDGGYTAA